MWQDGQRRIGHHGVVFRVHGSQEQCPESELHLRHQFLPGAYIPTAQRLLANL
jgi:hypothetical protein